MLREKDAYSFGFSLRVGQEKLRQFEMNKFRGKIFGEIKFLGAREHPDVGNRHIGNISFNSGVQTVNIMGSHLYRREGVPTYSHVSRKCGISIMRH